MAGHLLSFVPGLFPVLAEASPLDALEPVLWGVGLLAAGFYLRLAWKIWQRQPDAAETFGPREAGIAAALTALIVLAAATTFAAPALPGAAATPEGRMIVLSVVVTTVVEGLLVAGLLGALVWRGLSPAALFGFERLPVWGALGRGVGLLLVALPVVYATMTLTQRLTGGAERHGQEEAVRLVLASREVAPRLAMILAAVVVAPVVEELVFRGYLYGVMRRYLGWTAGTVLNAVLFAVIHGHVPSLGPLFVLAVCLTLAYEWTGSLLVPMTMHAVFNTLSISLLFLLPEQAGQP